MGKNKKRDAENESQSITKDGLLKKKKVCILSHEVDKAPGHNAGEEITAEERRILERKLKKKRKKEERKLISEAGVCTEVSLPSKSVKKVTAHKTEEELTAEERRMYERKLKKERKKEEKKLVRDGHVDIKKAEPGKPSGCELALQYLTSWSQKAEGWKFQKTRQTWLLLHMYDPQKVPRNHFTVLLDYLEGLRGSARDLTMQKAEALMKEHEKTDTDDAAVLEVMERARQVIQLLS
ncbi:protein cholesin [Ambystoma mexicanum]|uniref:protein cholesin n=1 Tax=Ambystoma mexicanum TaxID=8296 RepID=UPI0037E8E984